MSDFNTKLEKILVDYRKASFSPKPFISDRDEWNKKYEKNGSKCLEEAKQAIIDLIDKEIVGRSETSNIQIGYDHPLSVRNRLRAEQRNILKGGK